MHVNDINDALNDHSAHKINILLYADDLVIIASTRFDLQRKLDQYCHQYCIKKCLSVNIKNLSKILVIIIKIFRKPIDLFRFSLGMPNRGWGGVTTP